jgi:hypothetical protein
MNPNRNGLTSHILPTSANLVGACITAISVVKLVHRSGWGSLIDELLAWTSMIFLLSSGLSYASMRSRRQGEALEHWAERLFLVGLGLVFLAAAGLAYDIS